MQDADCTCELSANSWIAISPVRKCVLPRDLHFQDPQDSVWEYHDLYKGDTTNSVTTVLSVNWLQFQLCAQYFCFHSVKAELTNVAVSPVWTFSHYDYWMKHSVMAAENKRDDIILNRGIVMQDQRGKRRTCSKAYCACSRSLDSVLLLCSRAEGAGTQQLDALPSPTHSALDRNSPRLTGPVWKDMMSGCHLTHHGCFQRQPSDCCFE